MRALPTYRDLRAGRRKATLIRALLLGGALLLALGGPREISTVAIVAVLALCAACFPVPYRRHLRWVSWARSLREPTLVPGLAPASLHCDGAKITITCGGRVWGSLRPAATDSRLRVGRVGQELWLGLVPDRRHKRDALWFAGPEAELPPELREGLESLDPGGCPSPVLVSGPGWISLVEAFTDPRLLRAP